MHSLLGFLLLAQPLLGQVSIGPERPLTAADLHSAAFDQRDAATASDGSGWLVAWSSGQFTYAGGVIAATRIDADRSVLDPTPIVLGSGTVGHPAVAFGVDRYLVAWATPDSIRARLVGRDGDLSPSVQIATLSGGLPTPPLTVRAAWDGARFLVAWTYVLDSSFSRNRRSFAALDANAVTIASQTLAEGSIGIDFGLAAGSGQFVVFDTAPDFSGTPTGNGYPSAGRAFRIDDAAHVAGPISILPASTPLFSPRVAFNGREYLLVASTNSGLPGQSIGARLSVDGGVTPVAPFYSGAETITTLTWIGNEYVITLSDQQRVDALHLDTNGSPSLQQSLASAANTSASDAAWSGQQLLVAIDSNSDVYANFLDSSRPVALSPAHQQLPDVAAADGGDALVVWLESPNAMAMPLHNGLAASQPAALGAAFGAPVVAWSGTEYLAVWLAQAGAVGLRMDRSGKPLDGQPILIDSLASNFGQLAVTFDRQNFIVAYEIGAGGCFHNMTDAVRRVSPAGMLLDSNAIAVGGHSCGSTMSLASGSNGSLLTWYGPSGPSAAFITPDGSTPGAIQLSPMLTGNQIRAIWTGSQFLVADLTRGWVEWLTVTENGFLRLHGALATSQAANATSSSFTRFGDEALLAWTSGTLYGLRFALDGFAIDAPFAIPTGGFDAKSVAVADREVVYQRAIDFPSVPWLTRIFLRDVDIIGAPPRRRASR